MDELDPHQRKKFYRAVYNKWNALQDLEPDTQDYKALDYDVSLIMGQFKIDPNSVVDIPADFDDEDNENDSETNRSSDDDGDD